jgi:hypothetical protein
MIYLKRLTFLSLNILSYSGAVAFFFLAFRLVVVVKERRAEKTRSRDSCADGF